MHMYQHIHPWTTHIPTQHTYTHNTPGLHIYPDHMPGTHKIPAYPLHINKYIDHRELLLAYTSWRHVHRPDTNRTTHTPRPLIYLDTYISGRTYTSGHMYLWTHILLDTHIFMDTYYMHMHIQHDHMYLNQKCSRTINIPETPTKVNCP